MPKCAAEDVLSLWTFCQCLSQANHLPHPTTPGWQHRNPDQQPGPSPTNPYPQASQASQASARSTIHYPSLDVPPPVQSPSLTLPHKAPRGTILPTSPKPTTTTAGHRTSNSRPYHIHPRNHPPTTLRFRHSSQPGTS